MKLLRHAAFGLLMIVGSASDAEIGALRIARADLPNIAVQIRIGWVTEWPPSRAGEDTLAHPPLLSSSFDSLWNLPPEPLRTDFSRTLTEGIDARNKAAGFTNLGPVRYGLYSLRDRKSQMIRAETGTVLTILTDWQGFESIPHVIAAWRSEGDSLSFIGLLDRGMDVGIGGASFERAVGLPDSSYLLMGRTGGGDGGGVWGSVWFAHWKKPLDLDFVYEKSWDKPDTFGDLEVAMDSQFDPTRLQAVVTVRQRGVGMARFTETRHDSRSWMNADNTHSGSTNWTIVDADTVSFANLIAR